MTISSAQASANVARGKEAERQAARFLTVLLGTKIVRAIRTGHRGTADPGDLAKLRGMVCSVKDSERVYIEQWMAELDQMDGLDTDIRFLIHKWRNHAVARWHVYVRAGILIPLLTVTPDEHAIVDQWALKILWPSAGQPLRTPVRLELGAWAEILLQAGYGEAIPEEAL